ncbi:MAG: exodeoxyribonuclease VII small subunit [Bacteroides sp.]|nr:exodeoxyribonuclease VII small subunit [Bacteroidales bacterium]MBD5242561.1 exodeoxyribonuclease VII small subunit [Barnesiella sp.]MBD5315731.1 exodeoxyribonuclease VII small subunit [Bacteroides sp.]MDE6249949.1 exodeoxyribonuclease VII small subunit [Paramuribaculum sp.]MDE7449969.1 exodeoxyribonuclease VII small subunit [Paramuribaculum sp.]
MSQNHKDFTPVSELTYNQAVSELDSILRMMQSDQCDIDRLTAYTRRASELLRECRSRLTATDEELRGILADLTENV